MTRRQFLAAASVLAATPNRPNVLFLSVDDMNDWAGCLGGCNGVKTPHIDRLARRGALFTNAHCASPLCNPSRTALLTGRRPSTTGMYNNDQFWPPNLPSAVTIPMYFKANGYPVAGAGKVFHHTAGNNPPSQWDELRLQVFDDPWYRRAGWYPWNKRVPAPPGHPFNGLRNFQGEFDWGVIPASEREYCDQKAIDFGLHFLSKSHEKLFFLAIGLRHPHIPMFAPQPYFDLYPPGKVKIPYTPDDDLDEVPKIGREWAAARGDEHNRIVREGKWRDAVRAYLAAISVADAMLGVYRMALPPARMPTTPSLFSGPTTDGTWERRITGTSPPSGNGPRMFRLSLRVRACGNLAFRGNRRSVCWIYTLPSRIYAISPSARNAKAAVSCRNCAMPEHLVHPPSWTAWRATGPSATSVFATFAIATGPKICTTSGPTPKTGAIWLLIRHTLRENKIWPDGFPDTPFHPSRNGRSLILILTPTTTNENDTRRP